MQATDFFTFDSGSATNVGCVRKLNEDSLLARPEFGLWTVADGMGGHSAGDVASRIIVTELATVGVAASAEDQRARVLDRIARANAEIQDYSRRKGGGTVGATVVTVVAHDDEFSCIWAGDSRAYLLRDGRLHQLSEDHTEVRALLLAGVLTAKDAENWPRRHVITRAIGVSPEADCETVTGTLQPGDSLLLCSDGLTEHMTEADLARALNARVTAQAACDGLVAETLARGARDNVTVVVVRCLPPPPPDPDEDPEI